MSMNRSSAIISLVVFVLIAFMSSFAFAEMVKVQSFKVPVRKGPGWYHPVVKNVNRGQSVDVLERSGRWYKVKTSDGTIGYASKRSIKISAGSRAGSGKRKKGSTIKADRRRTSRPMMVAALRGVADMGLFPRESAKKYGLTHEEIEQLMEMPFQADDFKRFKGALRAPSGIASGLEGAELPASDREIGAAITMRILGAMKASRDESLRKYVSMVGAVIQEQTPVYDVPFVFIVLESKKVNSFSAPGGFVFITTGALDTIDSEAELAGVLSHELVHVLERHGMEELDRQSTRMKSSGAMDDLDKEIDMRGMDTGDRAVAADLEDMADQIFEKLISGRKMSDEDNSDLKGTRLLSKTGYSPSGLRDFIKKSSGKVTGEDLKTYAYRDAGRRASAITKLIKSAKLPEGAELADRFKGNAH